MVWNDTFPVGGTSIEALTFFSAQASGKNGTQRHADHGC
jgi:hypothetical protein